jgi:hypothetical protein
MSPGPRVLLVILVLLIGIFIAARMRYPGKPVMKLAATNCNEDLWSHVYEKDRLKVIEGCTAVEGRVVSLHRSKDGDLHIALDPDAKSVLNLVNALHAHRTLAVEAVCDHAPEEQVAMHACAGCSHCHYRAENSPPPSRDDWRNIAVVLIGFLRAERLRLLVWPREPKGNAMAATQNRGTPPSHRSALSTQSACGAGINIAQVRSR